MNLQPFKAMYRSMFKFIVLSSAVLPLNRPTSCVMSFPGHVPQPAMHSVGSTD